MGTRLYLIILLLGIFTSNTFAQDSPQWHLPEGVKARLGKGSISEIQYSPDGRRLAVASASGIWIYDAQTGEELDLLTGHTWPPRTIVFSQSTSLYNPVKIKAAQKSAEAVQRW